MIRRQEGFTLVELLVTMVIFVLTIAAASSIFAPLLTQFKQQSKVTETQVEGIVGLETLRRDIEQAGYGLPWNIPSGLAYQENPSSPASNTSDYNDSAPNSPRGIIGGSGRMSNAIGKSDYLVLKSTIVGTSDAAPKWTYAVGNGKDGCNVKCWNPADPTCGTPSPDDFNYPPGTNPWVIALIPSMGESETSQRILVKNGSAFAAQFGAGGTGVVNHVQKCIQDDYGSKYLVYGVETDTGNLKMPFNRADYYIATTGVTVPSRCAPGTGLLVKSVFSHKKGDFGTGLPLMDCVADMKILYGLDVSNNGNITYADDISSMGTYSAQTIRDQVKEVRVYILAHEGQKDSTYNATTMYPAGIVPVGNDTTVAGLGRDFNLKVIADWQMYRWKVYTMVVHTKNLL